MSEKDRVETLKSSLRRLLKCLDSLEGYDYDISDDTTEAIREAEELLKEAT